MLMKLFVQIVVQYLVILQLVQAGTKSKPHSHTGLLQAYDGRHIPYKISLEENAKLDAGQAVTVNERSGKDGRGLVIQDIDASPATCLEQIRALSNYPKVVPKVKKMDVYENLNFPNGTVKSSAEFNIGISFLTFVYYLQLTFEPTYNTVTWTLDYRYSSDFDDNTGHWQVMPHPTKRGWSRVLYSTEVKLPSWIPEFVITFLTKTALVESTGWVKKESERIDKSVARESRPGWNLPDISHCFIVDAESARYETHCIEGSAQSHSEL